MPIDDADVERALVVAAHPDDIDFTAAGTVASWTKAGIDVAYCVVTDGDAGGFDPSIARTEIPALRQREQRAAADAVGVSDIAFLGYPDGALEVTMALRRDISAVIRRVRPQRVLCQSPERNWSRIYGSHPDHLRCGEATLCAIYPDARNPFAHPELLRDQGLEAWTVPETWIMAPPAERANRFVDVTDSFDAKVAALRAHESQTAHLPDLAGFVRGWMQSTAFTAGLPFGRLAEAYHVIDTAG